MSMLAEPKRKQKLSADPRNTTWLNDESKFGQRMLERMGWSKGKGLGANEDGRRDNVATVFRLNNDARGVGCSKQHAETWIAHQDDFNSILESLNQAQTETTSTSLEVKPAIVSLEEKSKSSRSRVHYHKFTRGKDLSGRSSQDLDCIFGKRNGQLISSANQSDSEAASAERNATPGQEGTPDSKVNHHGFKTITSSSSIQEYFAQKLDELKKQRGNNANDNSTSDPDNDQTAVDVIGVQDSSNAKDEMKVRKKGKKKKKSKSVEDQNDAIVITKKTVRFSFGAEDICLEKQNVICDVSNTDSIILMVGEKHEKKLKRKETLEITDNHVYSQEERNAEALASKSSLAEEQVETNCKKNEESDFTTVNKKHSKKRKQNESVEDIAVDSEKKTSGQSDSHFIIQKEENLEKKRKSKRAKLGMLVDDLMESQASSTTDSIKPCTSTGHKHDTRHQNTVRQQKTDKINSVDNLENTKKRKRKENTVQTMPPTEHIEAVNNGIEEMDTNKKDVCIYKTERMDKRKVKKGESICQEDLKQTVVVNGNMGSANEVKTLKTKTSKEKKKKGETLEFANEKTIESMKNSKKVAKTEEKLMGDKKQSSRKSKREELHDKEGIQDEVEKMTNCSKSSQFGTLVTSGCSSFNSNNHTPSKQRPEMDCSHSAEEVFQGSNLNEVKGYGLQR